jgi:hypothetical protein
MQMKPIPGFVCKCRMVAELHDRVNDVSHLFKSGGATVAPLNQINLSVVVISVPIQIGFASSTG